MTSKQLLHEYVCWSLKAQLCLERAVLELAPMDSGREAAALCELVPILDAAKAHTLSRKELIAWEKEKLDRRKAAERPDVPS